MKIEFVLFVYYQMRPFTIKYVGSLRQRGKPILFSFTSNDIAIVNNLNSFQNTFHCDDFIKTDHIDGITYWYQADRQHKYFDVPAVFKASYS